MKVCIIGSGLVSLTLAKVLIQKDIFVDIYGANKSNRYHSSRTLGISKSNIDYFINEILDIKKISWDIQSIKIYTEKNLKKELIKFDNKNYTVFSMIRNSQLQKLLFEKLKKIKFVKFKKNLNIDKKDYKLIINSDPTHFHIKKFFSKKIDKDYNSYAYTTSIFHKKIKNDTAYQNFTNDGPIAFLPISNTETSIVYSLRSVKKKTNLQMNDLVKKYNPIYSIEKTNNWSRFKLKSSNLRNYYKDNILAFGDLLHKVHPLAGQGFNMSLRDISCLSKLIDEKLDLGLDLDTTICHNFEKEMRDKNLIFSTGIDWIYQFFYFEGKTNNEIISKSLNILGKNKFFNSLFKKFADNGLSL